MQIELNIKRRNMIKKWKTRRGEGAEWWWYAIREDTNLTILKINGVCRHLRVILKIKPREDDCPKRTLSQMTNIEFITSKYSTITKV